jgi:hypothetical protein
MTDPAVAGRARERDVLPPELNAAPLGVGQGLAAAADALLRASRDLPTPALLRGERA